MAKLPHSSTRRGFSTHNSIGTDNIPNPNMTGGSQPGMIELKQSDGTPYYLWVRGGSLVINSSIPTDPTTEGTVVGTQT